MKKQSKIIIGVLAILVLAGLSSFAYLHYSEDYEGQKLCESTLWKKNKKISESEAVKSCKCLYNILENNNASMQTFFEMIDIVYDDNKSKYTDEEQKYLKLSVKYALTCIDDFFYRSETKNKNNLKIAIVDIVKVVEKSKTIKNLKIKRDNQVEEFKKMIDAANIKIMAETNSTLRQQKGNQYLSEINEKKKIFDNEYEADLDNVDKKINNIILNVAKQNGYDIILNKSDKSVVVGDNTALPDITNMVLPDITDLVILKQAEQENQTENTNILNLSQNISVPNSIFSNVPNNLINADWWKTATLNDVKKEITNGTDINSKGNDYTKNGDLRTNVTPLVFAIKYGNSNPEIIKFLINNGADVNAKEGKVGLTVLMYVAQFCKNPNIMNMLIQAGADVNVGNNNGFTPLMSAVIHKNPQMVKAFIESGVNISAKDSNNKTALDYAYEYNDVEVINLLKNYTTKVNIPDLAQNLSVPNSVSGNFSNNLINADWWKNATLEKVKTEIAKGVNVNEKDDTGWTPLMTAAKDMSDPHIIQTLIDAGADVNAKTIYGITPLILSALFNYNPQIAKILIENDADVLAKDYENKTALDHAKASNNVEVLKLLENHINNK